MPTYPSRLRCRRRRRRRRRRSHLVMSCISFSPLQLSGGTDQAALELESEKTKELANIRTLATVRRVSEAYRFHLVNGAEPTCLPFPGEQAKGRGHAHRIRYRG